MDALGDQEAIPESVARDRGFFSPEEIYQAQRGAKLCMRRVKDKLRLSGKFERVLVKQANDHNEFWYRRIKADAEDV